jgi:hypothetical protein
MQQGRGGFQCGLTLADSTMMFPRARPAVAVAKGMGLADSHLLSGATT